MESIPRLHKRLKIRALASSSSHLSLPQGVTKRCRLPWLANSALVSEPKCGGEGFGVLANASMRTAVHRNPNKLWRSKSIFNLWSLLFHQSRTSYFLSVRFKPFLKEDFFGFLSTLLHCFVCRPQISLCRRMLRPNSRLLRQPDALFTRLDLFH